MNGPNAFRKILEPVGYNIPGIVGVVQSTTEISEQRLPSVFKYKIDTIFFADLPTLARDIG